MPKFKTIEFTDYEWNAVHNGGSQSEKIKTLYLYPILTLHAEEWNELENKNSWSSNLRFLFQKNYIRATGENIPVTSTIAWENAPMQLTFALYHQYSNFFLGLDLSVLKEKVST
jgi:hypothetical protein